MRTFEEIVKDIEATEKRCNKLSAQFKEDREHSYGELVWLSTAMAAEEKRMIELTDELTTLKHETIKNAIGDALQSEINAVYGVEP